MLLLAGAVAAGVTLAWMRTLPSTSPLRRENFRGHTVPTACGIAPVTGGLLGIAVASALGSAGGGATGIQGLAALGAFGLLGLWDDIAGTDDARGWKRHLRSLLSARPTSGAMKLVGGVIAGGAIAALSDPSVVGIAVGTVVVAGSANTFNLLDLRPARAAKFWLLAAVPLLVWAWIIGDGPTVAVLVPMGAALLAWIPADAQERAMLGDVGANAIGAALGVALLPLPFPILTGAAGVVVVLNLLGDKPGLSAIIQAVPPLRAFDRLGRMPD